MRRFFKSMMLLIVGLLLVVPTMKVKALDSAKIYIFYGDGCGYCKGAISYFESLEAEYGDMFDLVKLEVWYNEENSDLMQKVAKVYGDEVGGVPYIVIGEKTFGGYDLNGGTDADILEAIKTLYNSEERFDVMENLDVVLNEEEKTSNVGIYIVLVLVVILEVLLLVFARKNAVVTEEVKEEPKKVTEEKKVVKEETKTTTKTSTKKPATKTSTKATTKKTAAKTSKPKTTTKKTTTKKK